MRACEGGREVPNHNTDVITWLPASVIALHAVGTPETKGMSATEHSLIPRNCTEKLSAVQKFDLYSGHEDKRSDSGFRSYIQISQDKFQNLAAKLAMAAFYRILSLQKSLANRECYVAAKTKALIKNCDIGSDPIRHGFMGFKIFVAVSRKIRFVTRNIPSFSMSKK